MLPKHSLQQRFKHFLTIIYTEHFDKSILFLYVRPKFHDIYYLVSWSN